MPPLPARRRARRARRPLVVRPFDADAATSYRQPGPIFVHADPCAYQPSRALPEQLTRRLLSVHSFDAGHAMLGGAVVQGAGLEEAAVRLLEDDAVSYLHVHNAGPGCFAVRIDRVARPRPDPGGV